MTAVVPMPVYLDNAATTPVDPDVAAAMAECLTTEGVFGNPASRSHLYGWDAEERVEQARVEVAELLNCDPRELVWTSGATESDNLAIKGVLLGPRARGRHLITSRIEHKAVIDSCRWLEKQGFEVTWLTPEANGAVTAAAVAEALRPDTALVSLMAVNNELGVFNDIEAITAVTRAAGIPLHVDAAQALAKVAIDLAAVPVELMSFSGHKIYGPKGIGVLYVRRDAGLALEPQMHGGGHERGLRSGTLATHQIVGMGRACAVAGAVLDAEISRLRDLRGRFLAGLSALDDVHLNGDAERGVPGIVNLAFGGVDGEALILALSADVACSTASACTSATIEPSHVLRGIGLTDELAHASIRFSLGRFTTAEEVDFAAGRVVETVTRLRASFAGRPRRGAL
ncbi:MAG: aminotransferase class V-fold PLP-dependent enzyme [Gammaproteobacteria bacterium]|nr:aminotransferase class V-fold PLP-dependent enzyme [Gammaproteobacteria bacterium]